MLNISGVIVTMVIILVAWHFRTTALSICTRVYFQRHHHQQHYLPFFFPRNVYLSPPCPTTIIIIVACITVYLLCCLCTYYYLFAHPPHLQFTLNNSPIAWLLHVTLYLYATAIILINLFETDFPFCLITGLPAGSRSIFFFICCKSWKQ